MSNNGSKGNSKYIQEIRKDRGNSDLNLGGMLYLSSVKAMHFGSNMMSSMIDFGETFFSKMNRSYDVRKDLRTINREMSIEEKELVKGLESELKITDRVDFIELTDSTTITVHYQL